MSERFQTVYRSEPNLYIEGSPVLIEAAAIQKDTKTDKILAQIKFRNITAREIIAIKILIRSFAIDEAELDGIPDFLYLDLHEGYGNAFGDKTPIFLPDSSTRQIAISVTEVIFDDHTKWTSPPCEWKPLPEPIAIERSMLGEELARQFQLEIGDNAIYAPSYQDDLFVCTCGAIYEKNCKLCYRCGRSDTEIFNHFDKEQLLQNHIARIEQEETERIEAQHKTAVMRKRIIIGISVILIVSAIATTLYMAHPYIEKVFSYHKASQLMEQGEYDEAKSIFQNLNNFKDSENMALEADYKHAEALVDTGNYEDAIHIWKSIQSYSDSKERIIEATDNFCASQYDEASALIKEKKYKAAYDILRELKSKDYKEYSALYYIACYRYASQLYKNKQYDKAAEYFQFANNYKNAKAKYKQAVYKGAILKLNSYQYLDAINGFKKCRGYKDADAKKLEAEFGYISALKRANNRYALQQSAGYLEELLAANYPGANELYNEVRQWHIENIVFSNSENGKNSSSISKFDPVYVTFKVDGGIKMTDSLALTMKTTFPDGSVQSQTETCGVGLNSYYWENGIWQNPYLGETGTLSIAFYDENGSQIGYGSVQITD